MRPNPWLITLWMLSACSGNRSPLPPLALEWTHGVGPALSLVDASSGGIVVGYGTSFVLYAPSDAFLTSPQLFVDLGGTGVPVVVLSATRAIFARSDPSGPSSALVADLTSGWPPHTWTVDLAPGSTPLVADGEWLLSSYVPGPAASCAYASAITAADCSPGVELVNLEQPERRFTHAAPGEGGPAFAAQGYMLAFTQGHFASNPGDVRAGWLRISPELAPADGWIEEQVVPEMEDVVEAVVEGGEVLVANVVHATTDEPMPRLRIARYGLAEGAPLFPALKSIEVGLPLENPVESARFAWGGDGKGVVGGLEWLSPCHELAVDCLATALPAYLIEEEPFGFSARPILSPYVELDGDALPLGWGRTRTMAALGGQLLAATGGERHAIVGFDLAWYLIDPSRDTRFCRGDVTIADSSDLRAFRGRGCTTLKGDLMIQGGDLEEVILPDLEVVDGLLIASTSHLRTVRLPALVTDPGITICGGGSAESGGCSVGLYIADNAELERIEMPSLVSVFELAILRNPSLANVDLTQLSFVRQILFITDNPMLSQCWADALLAGLATQPAAVIDGNDMLCP